MAISSVLTEQEVLQVLERDTRRVVLVTSTARAARALRARYDRAQQEKARTGWLTPQVLGWEAWLSTLWTAAIACGAETRALLSPLQELHLWKKVLQQDEAARRTLSSIGLAELAQQASRELERYRIPLKLLRGESGQDAQAFSTWVTEMASLCGKSSWLLGAQMETAIAGAIASGKLKLPQQVLLIGFDRTTPSQRAVLDALEVRGCQVSFTELQAARAPGASQPVLVYARTLDQEIVCAVQWIRQRLLSNPAQRIGVIVPASAELRDRIDATFRAVLAPSSMDIRAARTELPYEFSLGTPMVRLSPIRTALSLLRWMHAPIPAEELSWLLVHGWFSDIPSEGRATLDRKFRERTFQLGGPASFSAFRQWLLRAGNSASSEEESAPLRRTLDDLAATVPASRQGNATDRLRSFAEWREFMEELLRTANFRLLKPATSQDFQLLQRWNAMLNDLSSLNAVAGPVRFSSALEQLEHLANNTLFALETTDAPVQVLGIPESAGLAFDAVWWMNAQASVWPPQGRAQPLLPWGVQRAAHMPYADPVEDYAFAQRVTRRILRCGKDAVVSFALQNSDPATASSRVPDREVVVSPLVREALPDTPMIAAEELLPHAEGPGAGMQTPMLEKIYEEPAVPFLSAEVRGGVRFLELQSACPFRSFAELRLGARPLADFAAGLDPATQGTIVHKVLQKFWEETGSQMKLLQTGPAELRQILHKHIQTELADFAERASETWQAALLRIEGDRMEERLLLWLEREKSRPEFTVIETEDELEHSQLGGIHFRCRVDRIDAVEQGHVLLDYKTGIVNRSECMGDRPDQPQLPVYAVLREQQNSAAGPLAGIAFAGLHPRKVDFTIVGSLPSVFSRPAQNINGQGSTSQDDRPAVRKSGRFDAAALSPSEMRAQVAEWDATLARLANDFRDGVAVVGPKNESVTCTHCALALLCRIREASGGITPSDSEDENGASLEDSHDD
ncbi:MAG: PD-(D/E)XK nuclease family protein [Acidobacteriaceae bacterium]